MKSVMSFAVCGIFAFAVQANAQAAKAVTELSESTLVELQKSRIARDYLQKNLGIVTGTSVADANKLLNQSANRAAILAAINAYRANAVAANDNNPAAVSQNADAARKAFTSNGQVIVLAAAAQGVAQKGAVSKGADQCEPLIAQDMVVDGGPSYAVIQNLIFKGVIHPGNCTEHPAKIKDPKLKAVLIRTAEIMHDEYNVNRETPDSRRIEVGGPALAKARGDLDPAKFAGMSARDREAAEKQAIAKAKQNFIEINSKCHWLGQPGAQIRSAKN